MESGSFLKVHKPGDTLVTELWFSTSRANVPFRLFWANYPCLPTTDLHNKKCKDKDSIISSASSILTPCFLCNWKNTHPGLRSSKNDIRYRCETWKMNSNFFSLLMNIEQINKALQDPAIYWILCFYFLHYSSHNVTQEYLRDDNQAIKDSSVQALALPAWIMALSLANPGLNPCPWGTSGCRWLGSCGDMYFLTLVWHGRDRICPLASQPSRWLNTISRSLFENANQ